MEMLDELLIPRLLNIVLPFITDPHSAPGMINCPQVFTCSASFRHLYEGNESLGFR
jgi:hypothetical protein